jgi:hypothetical protein
MNITLSDALSRKRAINNKVLIYTFFKNCNRVNESGVLVFTKAGTTELKPVIITIANANPEFPDLELSNYIRLNALGQIPEDMKIEFIISDELGAEELYDIYIYTSDLKIEECDENFVFRPRAQEYQQFLIQVLNDRPFLDEDTIEPIATIGIQNLVKYGQFQAVTLAENPKTVISSSESIAENIFYFANVANTNEVEDVVADQLTIENTELIWNLESKPARYLSINAINKPNAVPNARYLALRFQNGNLFDAEDVLNLKPFIVSFQAKADQIIELNLSLQRVFSSTIEGTIVSLQQSEPIVVSTEWQKFSIVCNIDSTTQPIINDVNECFILFSLPANNIFDNFTVDFTNLLVYFGDTEIIYPPEKISTNQFQEKIPQAYSPVINSPQGYIPLPLTVGRVTEYLYETSPQDKPTEIYADGRALKVNAHYKYALNYATNIEIPHRWLFDKYGDRYGSGKDFMNAMSPQSSLNFDASSWVGITDFIIHTNDVSFIDDAPEFINVAGNNNLFAKVNVFSYGYNNPTDYQIETYFVRENSSYLSLGIMADSGFIEDKLNAGNFDFYLYGQKKTAIGNTTLNNQIKELTTAKDALYSTVKPHNQNFIVWGNTSLPTNLYIAPESPNSQRYAKCIVANSLMSNNNFKFINANAGAFADTTPNYSLRICIEQADIAGTHEPFQIFQSGTGEPLSHATITCYNPDVTDDTIVLTQNMNIFPLKYQISGQVAVGILLKTNPTLTEFDNSYFNITVKTKIYTFWYSIFGFTEVPTAIKNANPSSEDFIMIDMSGALNLADPKAITARIMKAVNSYIFCIPDLRGMNSFSAGEGKQASFINGYNIDNLGNIPNPSPALVDEIKTLKPILTNNLDNFVDFMPELNLKMALNASDGTSLYLRPADTSSAPSSAVRRYYPIDAEHHSINSQPVSLVNKYISLC